MSDRWRHHRSAAYVSEEMEFQRTEVVAESALAAADTETLYTADGEVIGARYGGDEDAEALAILGDAFHKQFASAMPDPRAGYERSDLELDEREEARRRERERWGGISPEGAMAHYVSRDARGRSSSGRKAPKKTVKVVSGDGGAATGLDAPEDNQIDLSRFVVRLTKGVIEFYARQEVGAAHDVLKSVADQLLLAGRVSAVRSVRMKVPRHRFVILGLSPLQAWALREAQCAAVELERHAYSKDGARIARRDAPAIEVECEQEAAAVAA